MKRPWKGYWGPSAPEFPACINGIDFAATVLALTIEKRTQVQPLDRRQVQRLAGRGNITPMTDLLPRSRLVLTDLKHAPRHGSCSGKSP